MPDEHGHDGAGARARDDRPTLAGEGATAFDAPGRPVAPGRSGVWGIPDRIGNYEIRRVIASGGMGTVFEAVQDQPRRVVALKVMRAGVASAAALRRFEHEAQILGRLRHPGIAQVYEAGAQEVGGAMVPYFAMEYVAGGRAITEHAAARRMPMRERLALFAEVCDAVHHGHQKGVIHRDLKPANILVDAAGRAKVIDFGVARATDSDVASTTQHTEAGQVIGTLQYMSPEQIDADPSDIDVRSDVYTLGVALYELLAGRPPYTVADSSAVRAGRIIKEQAPTSLSAIAPALRGDVETIVLKALEKERERRYQSALELKQDIERYLASEPISARKPSVVYQVRVFARRNKAAFGAAVAVLVVALAAAVVSVGFALREAAARRAADRANAIAQRQRAEADAARDGARREAENAEAANRFLREVLSMASPSRAMGRTVTVRDAVEQAAGRIPSLTTGRPGTEAAIRSAVGATLRSLGQFEQAEGHLRAAVELLTRDRGEDAPETLGARMELAAAIMERGMHAEALEETTRALQGFRRSLGDRAAPTIQALNQLAWHLYNAGRAGEAEPLFRETLVGFDATLGKDAQQSIKARTNLAACLADVGKTDEALPLAERGRDGLIALLGPKHPDSVYARHIHAYVLMQRDRYAEAAALYGPIVADAIEVYGAEHPYAVYPENNLAWSLLEAGRPDEAQTVFERVLDVRRRTLGPDHRFTFDTLRGIARSEHERGRSVEALAIVTEAYGRCAGAHGREDHESRNLAELAGAICESLGRADEAGSWRARAANDGAPVK